MMDIAAAEEEINRWKVAAEQEAAAGRGVEQEFVAQVWNAICWQDFFFGMFAILGGF
jgi:membrane protein required for beta-lactamase induction